MINKLTSQLKQQALLDNIYINILIHRYKCETSICSNNDGFCYLADGKIHLRIFTQQLKTWSIAINDDSFIKISYSAIESQFILNLIISEFLIAFYDPFLHLKSMMKSVDLSSFYSIQRV